jgi:hypothetical protein
LFTIKKRPVDLWPDVTAVPENLEDSMFNTLTLSFFAILKQGILDSHKYNYTPQAYKLDKHKCICIRNQTKSVHRV